MSLPKNGMKDLTLIAYGESNWDYYLQIWEGKAYKSLCPTDYEIKEFRTVWYIPKPGIKCGSGIFSDLDYFTKYYRKNSNSISLTEYGKKMLKIAVA